MKKIITKTLALGIFGMGLAATLIIPTMLANASYAEGSSSFFDAEGVICILENYRSQTGEDVSIEEVDFNRITTLNCPSYGIKYLNGLTLMSNLEYLNLAYNENLSINTLDFSNNPKLKTIDLRGLGYNGEYLDLRNNPDVEFINIDQSIGVKTIASLRKMDDGIYGIDLSDVKFIDSNYRRLITYPDGSMLDKISVTFGGYLHSLSTNLSMTQCVVYADGVSLTTKDDGCRGHYVTEGEIFDTDDIIENIINKAYDLEGYELSYIKLTDKRGFNLTVDTDLVKKGTFSGGYFTEVQFYYELKSEDADAGADDAEKTPKIPDTGSLKNGKGNSIAGNISMFIASGIIAMVPITWLISKIAAKNRKKKGGFVI